MNNRIMIFIDAEYVVQKIKDCKKGRKHVRRRDIEWANIIQWIVNRRNLIRCYYYSAEFSKVENMQTYNEQQEYLRKLKLSIPYFDIKLGRLVHINNAWVQKGLDVKIALDMFSKAAMDHYDTAAIISGDSDFAGVITKIKERYAKHIELYTFDNSIHEALRMVPDKHFLITPQIGKQFNLWHF